MTASVKVCFLIVLVSALAGCGKETQPAAPSPGEIVFNGTCKVCHAQGINGAPILGNKAMWAKRVPQGIPTLVEHASNGYGLMPAKGGNTALTQEDIQAAVTFMVSKVQD